MCSLIKSVGSSNNLSRAPVLTKHVRRHTISRPLDVAPYTRRVTSSQTPTHFPYVWDHEAQSQTNWPRLHTWLILSIHEHTGAKLSSRGCVIMCVCVCVRAFWCACVCVCVYVCMTGYILADDGMIIRLCKRLILFHIKSCYLLKRCRPQLSVCLFYLLTNTLFVSYIDNV